jgi:ribosome biogenesis GTPase
MTKGRILQSLSGYYDILADDQVYRTRARGNFRQKKITPLVGDWVDFKANNQQEGYLLAVTARKNSLVRPPIANVDLAIVVVSCKQPDFSANLLDRQLVMLELQKIAPLIYFSKIDLLDQKEQAKFNKIMTTYQLIYPVFKTAAKLKAYLSKTVQAQTIVVMGQTGAGKSTLLNQLDPAWQLPTAEVSKALSRGKHTTRKVALLAFATNYIADTPGFSSFELQQLDFHELRDLFPEFLAYQPNCKFRGCLHQNEPRCAVKQAVAIGQIALSRYHNYLQLLVELKNKKRVYK